jgi:RND superfamily putative drug exporter
MLTMQRRKGRVSSTRCRPCGEPERDGQAFDDAKNDDSFYLPPEVFDNPTSSAA